MTVLDASGAIDFLLGGEAAQGVEEVLEQGAVSAPDLIVFEVLAVLRREVGRGRIAASRAEAAIDDLGDLPVDLFPGLLLRERVWELRENMTVADAMYVALAEQLGVPLATKDAGLVAAIRVHSSAEVTDL